ncbi:MAG: hypothetical protein ACK5LX_15210 [Oscillospiraceae bacterium]
MKKVLSVLLSLFLVVGIGAGLSLGVSAESDLSDLAGRYEIVGSDSGHWAVDEISQYRLTVQERQLNTIIVEKDYLIDYIDIEVVNNDLHISYTAKDTSTFRVEYHNVSEAYGGYTPDSYDIYINDSEVSELASPLHIDSPYSVAIYPGTIDIMISPFHGGTSAENNEYISFGTVWGMKGVRLSKVEESTDPVDVIQPFTGTATSNTGQYEIAIAGFLDMELMPGDNVLTLSEIQSNTIAVVAYNNNNGAKRTMTQTTIEEMTVTVSGGQVTQIYLMGRVQTSPGTLDRYSMTITL